MMRSSDNKVSTRMLRPRTFGIFVLLCLGGVLSAFSADFAVLRNGFSIRHERRQVIDAITRLYLPGINAGYVDIPTSEIERFEKDQTPVTPAPTPGQTAVPAPNLNDVINSVSDRHHLDPDLINSVIRAESAFNPRAVSPKGAQGLMQLMPNTASQLGVANAFNPQANVEGGTRYLRELLERYNFDLIKALAAYNAGPHRVEQYRGVPPYYETRAYVARIIRDFNRKKLAQEPASKVSAHGKSAAALGHESATKSAPPSRQVPASSPQPSE
jgi:transglycosylase-like protein with SLT domain